MAASATGRGGREGHAERPAASRNMGAEDETDALGGQLRGSNNWERESGRERKREIGFRRGSNILSCLHESQIVEVMWAMFF